MTEKELIKITYDDDSGWSITYASGKWVESVSRNTIDDAINSLETFLDERKKILESQKNEINKMWS